MRLERVSDIRLGRNLFSQIRVGGNRRLYRFLLSVCRLLYECMAVCERTGDVTFRDFRRDEATMWRLFEEFVTAFYEREQYAYRVNSGGRYVPWANRWARDELSEARIPSMHADVILESPDRRIIMDTKFYRNALAGRFESNVGKLGSANLYQLLAYLRNRQAILPEGPKHEGILLYPETDNFLRADVGLEGFRIQARTVNLNQDWRKIHDELLDTIGISGTGR